MTDTEKTTSESAKSDLGEVLPSGSRPSKVSKRCLDSIRLGKPITMGDAEEWVDLEEYKKTYGWPNAEEEGDTLSEDARYYISQSRSHFQRRHRKVH